MLRRGMLVQQGTACPAQAAVLSSAVGLRGGGSAGSFGAVASTLNIVGLRSPSGRLAAGAAVLSSRRSMGGLAKWDDRYHAGRLTKTRKANVKKRVRRLLEVMYAEDEARLAAITHQNAIEQARLDAKAADAAADLPALEATAEELREALAEAKRVRRESAGR